MRNLLSLFSLSIAIVFLLVQSACRPSSTSFEELSEEEANNVRVYPDVDERLWPHFKAFEEEAAARNWQIDLTESNISATIEEHGAGQCSIRNRFSRHITVDLEFWSRSNHLFKEFIIFHELGHCFLGRGLREDAFSSGACKSIMRSGVEDCRDNYNNRTRSTYIDELFNPDAV